MPFGIIAGGRIRPLLFTTPTALELRTELIVWMRNASQTAAQRYIMIQVKPPLHRLRIHRFNRSHSIPPLSDVIRRPDGQWGRDIPTPGRRGKLKTLEIRGWTANSQWVVPLEPGKPIEVRIVRMQHGLAFQCQRGYVGVRH